MPRFAAQRTSSSPRIDITYSNWYNPELDYKYFMVPGILGELVTILVMILTAMNVVRGAGNRHHRTSERDAYSQVAVHFGQNDSLPFRWPLFDDGRTGSGEAHFRHPDGRQFVAGLCLLSRQFATGARPRPAHFQFGGHSAAGHVRLLLFCHHLRFDEWAFHPHRVDAAMGTVPHHSEPHRPFCECDAAGAFEGEWLLGCAI